MENKLNDQNPYASKTFDKQFAANKNTTKNREDESITHKVGDSIERLGEKVIKAGAEKLGRAIYNAGDKIEHMSDDKKPSSKI